MRGISRFASLRVTELERSQGRIVPWLFPHLGPRLVGQRIRDFRKAWTEACTGAGVEGLTPHDLRHTVATNLIREKVPLIDVSKLLGHSSTAITERIYVNHQPQFLTGAIKRLEKLAGVA